MVVQFEHIINIMLLLIIVTKIKILIQHISSEYIKIKHNQTIKFST